MKYKLLAIFGKDGEVIAGTPKVFIALAKFIPETLKVCEVEEVEIEKPAKKKKSKGQK